MQLAGGGVIIAKPKAESAKLKVAHGDSVIARQAGKETKETEATQGTISLAVASVLLNTEVYEEHFSDAEKELMLLQTSEPSENEDYKTKYTEKTEDYLTILSVEESAEYMDAIETMGLDFWFRTPGNSLDAVCFISAPTHTMHTYGCPADHEGIAVRPIIQVDRSRLP